MMTIEDINKLLKIDGEKIKAIDVVTSITPEQALKMISFIIGKLSK